MSIRTTIPLFLAALAGIATAQAPASQGKLEEWPALKDTDKDRVFNLIDQLKKPNAQLHEEAQKQLVSIGAAAMPLLLQKVSDAADNVNDKLFAVCDQVLGPSHAALMAREAKKPRVAMRRYLTLRLCRFGDAAMAPIFESMLKDKDELTVFYAQLGLLAQKRKEMFAPILAFTKTRWNEVSPLVAEVLTPARSLELGEAGFEAIAKAPAVEQMAGLRLLRHLMVKEQSVILRRYLEASEHTVKREAVNTARVLHGEPPTENLSVFQAIEQAKEWLKKL